MGTKTPQETTTCIHIIRKEFEKFSKIEPRVMQKNFFGQYASERRRGFWPFFDPNLQKMKQGKGLVRGQNVKNMAKIKFFVNLLF